MRTRSSAPVLCTVALALLVALLPVPAGAQNRNGNAADISIPTLDGVGLATLAGALSIGGAWILARNRGKRK